MNTSLCPCGTKKIFDKCCNPYLSGQKFPNSPETLMRSRYSAYSMANIEYIQATMREPASIHFDPYQACEWATEATWLGLKIISVEREHENKGYVEFLARYRSGKTPHKIHEKSEFHRIDGRWYYVNGKLIN